MKFKYIFVFLYTISFFYSLFPAFSQQLEVKNVNFKSDGKVVTIKYDLEGMVNKKHKTSIDFQMMVVKHLLSNQKLWMEILEKISIPVKIKKSHGILQQISQTDLKEKTMFLLLTQNYKSAPCGLILLLGYQQLLGELATH